MTTTTTKQKPWFSKRSFFAIPTEILNLELSTNELSVYLVLAKYANSTTGECWPSQFTICEELRWFYESKDGALVYDNARVSKTISSLKSKGLLTTRRRKNQSSIITLISPSTPIPSRAHSGAVPPAQNRTSTSLHKANELTVQDVQSMPEQELYELLDTGWRPSNPEVDDAILRRLNPEFFEDEPELIPDSLGATADYQPGTFYEPVDFSDDEIFAS